MFSKIKLRSKLLLTVSFLTVFALFFTTFLWAYSTNIILRGEIIAKQENIGQMVTQRITELLRAKLTNLILNSQSVAVLEKDFEVSEYQIQTMLSQDKDLLEVSFIDTKGEELLRISPGQVYTGEGLRIRERDPAFVVPMFRYATEYISSVYFTPEGIPAITMAVPILPPPAGTRALERIRTVLPEVLPGTVRGVLVAEVSLEDIMRAVAEIEIEGGSIYLLEHKDNKIIGHTNRELVGESFSDVEVNQIIHGQVYEKTRPEEDVVIAQGKNENNVAVLAIHAHLPTYGWGITVQQPLAIAFAPIQRVYTLAGILFVAILSFSLAIGVWLSNKILRPISILRKGADIIGSGNYDYKVEVETKDELHQLANAFNKMANDIKISQAKVQAAKAELEKQVEARTRELKELTERQEEVIKQRTKEIQERMHELERFHKLAVGRELAMVELKEQIKKVKNARASRS